MRSPGPSIVRPLLDIRLHQARPGRHLCGVWMGTQVWVCHYRGLCQQVQQHFKSFLVVVCPGDAPVVEQLSLQLPLADPQIGGGLLLSPPCDSPGADNRSYSGLAAQEKSLMYCL